MRHKDTASRAAPSRLLMLVVCAAAAASAQDPGGVRPPADWRRIGNTSVLRGLAGPSGGPIERVWFSDDGARLYARTAGGAVFATLDWEQWTPAPQATPPEIAPAESERLPEPFASPRALRRRSALVYAFGANAWRSEDAGATWANLTGWRGGSLLGGRVNDLAVSPLEESRIVAGTDTGVWASSDGGKSWFGLNEELPNLAVRRILAAPAGARGLRVSLEEPGGAPREAEWSPGRQPGWVALETAGLEQREAALRASATAALGTYITAAAESGDWVYAGAADGRIWSSPDRGRTWRPAPGRAAGVAVVRFWVDAAEPRSALALFEPGGQGPPRVERSVNGGGSWDDLTANLPAARAFGLDADRASGAIYLATARGVYHTISDLRQPTPAGSWSLVSRGLPEAAVRDVRLGPGGHMLYAALDGFGVYAAPAPHRARFPALVHSADYTARAAAPGALLSVLGARIRSASAGEAVVPVLAAGEGESQIQVPFELRGAGLQLTVQSAAGTLAFGLPLEATAPAVLVDTEGTPMLLDGESGVQLDALHPARAGTPVQILATGLGRVTPDWPTSVPAPLTGSPRVAAPVRALLDGEPVEVLRAVLAPGYIGYYLVEIRLPEFVNQGAGELRLEAGGRESNRVRIYLDR